MKLSWGKKMSRRRIEAGINNASSFSLRECVIEKNSSIAAVQAVQAVPVAASSPTTAFKPRVVNSVERQAQAPKLTFNLEGLKTASSSPGIQAGACSSGIMGSAKPISLYGNGNSNGANGANGPLINAFGIPQNPLKYSSSASNPEVMRLSAQVEDLRSRLKASADKGMFLDQQVQKLQKLAMKERTEFSKQMSLARNEIGSLKDVEGKLKAEMTKMTSAVEKKAMFESAVKSALNTKEYVETQAKIDELNQKYDVVKLQMKELEDKRESVVSETNSAIASKNQHMEEVVETEAKIEYLKNDVSKLEQKVNEKKDELDSEVSKCDDVLRLNAILKIQSTFLNSKLETARRMHLSTASQIEDLNSQIVSKKNELKACNPVAPVLKVYGDFHPDLIEMQCVKDSAYKRADDMAAPASGMPPHFSLDAPISLTGHSTQMIDSMGGDSDSENDENTSMMLSAIVGDLKAYLAEASVQNEKRGLNRGVPTGNQASPLGP